MIYLYFLLAGFLYTLSASLPFWTTLQLQLYISIFVGIGTNILWALISRSVEHKEIPIVGLYYDLMLTLLFLITPFLFIPFHLTFKQIIGILLIFLGIILIKA